MSRKHIVMPPVIDGLLETAPASEKQAKGSRTENSPRVIGNRHIARPLQFPRDRLALTFQRCREQSGLSFSQLADRSGVDVAHIWRIEHGEHQNVSREVLILLSIAMVLGSQSVDLIVEVANEILDSAGLKMLRAPQHASLNLPSSDPRHKKNGSNSWR